ncbi:hypothetical protein [Pelagimonas varians]|uniref:Caudovirales tail fibre assembly protein n=1 Tax=Pelagimonas varians TaxID=696760 RepID=A0A238JYM9_9RHOB|nr:hypothetical protein [Pelagimonas varians]PYG33131.1 hypothetical protein C8N36_102126 [Pelagimonas varians]SMX35771.1 hypothetical protein PEV8663_00588 [Pelagimonas varians]
MQAIDYSQIITGEAQSAADMVARAGAIKGKCRANILAVLDEYTLSNIQGAAIAGELDAGDMDIFRAGRAWVAAMLDECRAAISSGDDPAWPDLPAGVADLAEKY